MNLSPVIISIPIYFVLIGIELLVERAQQVARYRFPDAVTNISCGIGQQVTGLFLKVFGIGIYTWVHAHFALWSIPDTWWAFVGLFFAYDLCYYWAHRLSHEINLLWSGHVVHHQSEDYNLSVALRQSWFQGVFTFYVYLPLALAGFAPESLVYVSGLNLLYQFWIHTETVGKLGWLEYVLNTPSHHRVHHGRNPEYIDKNYAGVFIIWDHIFGTFQPEVAPPVYGITTPVNSWNPIWANFSHYGHIWRQVQQTPGWLDKLRVVFYKPGWRPAALGGPVPIPDVHREDYEKFDLIPPMVVNYYVFGQYVLLLVGTAVFLFSQHSLTQMLKLTGALWIGVGILAGGGLLEHKRWAFGLETFRLLATVALAGHLILTFFVAIPLQLPVFLGLAGWVLGSLYWLWRVRQATQKWGAGGDHLRQRV
jgi:alkylglycerol monooxygenase